MNGIGRPKVQAAREHVRKVNPWTAIAALETDIATLTAGHVAGLDCLLVAVDNDRARVLAARLGLAARLAILDAAVRADLFVARVTISAPGAERPCLLDGWSHERLARAGEDVGMPCAGLDDGPPYGSTLSMAQAGAALATHQALALAEITGEPAWPGHELRLDLHAGRLDRVRQPLGTPCAADHELASGRIASLDVAPCDLELGTLMRRCDVGSDASIVLATAEIVTSAVCSRCGRRSRPYLRPPLAPCRDCRAPLAAMRRARRLAWAEAAPVVGAAAASEWFEPGDVLAVVDGESARVFAFPPPILDWDRGRPWDACRDAARFARLPRRYDLARIRATRLGLVGVGHLGSAILEALAPLPWAALMLCDPDRFEAHNAAASRLAAGAARGGA